MLLLLFYLGEERYVLDSARLVEIIPQVNLRPVYQVPQYVAGVLNYRGKVVPVVDLGLLIQGNPCCRCLSTRIIIVNYPLANGKTHYLGLLAERVTDTLNPSNQEFTKLEEASPCKGEVSLLPRGGFSPKTAYLGEMLVDQQGIIGRLALENLFSEAQQQWFLPENRSE